MGLDDKAQPLTTRVARSSMWMLFNSAASRALTLATQIILALILSQSDFGVWAIALSVSVMLTNFRGGGMLQWLMQGGQEKYAARAGDAFWSSLAFNCLLGLLIVALASPAGKFYGNSDVFVLLLISGCSFPLMTFGSFYKNALSIQIRMREVTWIELASALIRNSLMIVFATAGLGPLSFVLPLPISYLMEGGAGFIIVRDRPWQRHSYFRQWPKLIIRNRWILAGTFVSTVTLNADYFILGKLAPLAVVGVYFFAYQMTYRTAVLITENARRVLFPSLVAVPKKRRTAAALRAARTYLTLGAPLLMLVAVVFGPLQTLIWNGKWEDSVSSVQLLSIGLPLQLLTVVAQSMLQGEGRFKLWASVNTLRALIITIGALTAGIIFPENNTEIAAFMASAFAVGNALHVCIAFLRQGTTMIELIRTVWRGILVAPTSLVVVLFGVRFTSFSPIVELVVSLAAFACLHVALSVVFSWHDIKEAKHFLRSAF